MNEGEIQAALLRVAVGLDGPVVPDADTAVAWEWTARRERAIPLLYQLVDRVPTNLTDGQRRFVAQQQGAVLSRCVQLEHHVIAARELLGDEGIPSIVLKGGATAHLDYPDPAWREVSDIDLLIHPEHRGHALAILSRVGWHQAYALPGGHEEFTHAITLAHDRMELDLHQRISRRALGLMVPTSELFERAEPYVVAGSTLLALGRVDRFLHSALHAVAARDGHRRLSSVADVLLGAQRRPHLAPEVLARAERWTLRPLVERAVRQAYAMARLEVHPEWAEAMARPIGHRDRLVEVAYGRERHHPVLVELAYVRRLRGWRTRWRYAVGYFETSSAYAEQHQRDGARAQTRYVLAKLRGRS